MILGGNAVSTKSSIIKGEWARNYQGTYHGNGDVAQW